MKLLGTLLQIFIIGFIVVLLFAFVLSCSDETTIIRTEVVENHHDHHNHGKYRPYQSKSCQVVIDSLEAELEECHNE